MPGHCGNWEKFENCKNYIEYICSVDFLNNPGNSTSWHDLILIHKKVKRAL